MAHDSRDLIGSVYGSLTGPEGQAAFVATLALAFRSQLVARQIDRPGNLHTPLEHFDAEGRPATELANMASRQAYVNPWFASPMTARLLSAGVGGDEGCLAPDALRRTEFYADILRPHDLFHSFGFVLDRSGATSVISVTRSHRIGHYTPSEHALALEILPHLRNVHAIQMSLAWGSMRDRLDCGYPAWILSIDKRVLASNVLAQAEVEAGCLLAERMGSLFPMAAGDRTHWDNAVKGVAAGISTQDRYLLGDASGHRVAVAHLYYCGMEAFRSWLLVDRPSVLVVLKRLDAGASGIERWLPRLYGLTAAETRVAAALFKFGNLHDAAQQLHRNEETIRSQLKSIYAKTGTHSQGRLMKLIASLSTP
jgi:DNA-binding CsgD family transcriptional regulator